MSIIGMISKVYKEKSPSGKGKTGNLPTRQSERAPKNSPENVPVKRSVGRARSGLGFESGGSGFGLLLRSEWRSASSSAPAPTSGSRSRLGSASGSGAALIFVIIACIAGGFAGGYMTSMPQISQLQGELSNAKSQISSLSSEYSALNNNYTILSKNYTILNNEYSALNRKYAELSSNYRALQSEYQRLSSEYGKLSSDYTNLKKDYSALQSKHASETATSQVVMDRYLRLSEDVLKISALLESYSRIPDCFQRILCEEQVKKVESAVKSAGATSKGSASEVFASVGKIYDWIKANVKYAADIEMPYISAYEYFTLEGKKYLTSLHTSSAKNYVQTPELTLKIMQGDCDDQAVLAYAMIKYYMRYVYGTEYSLYFALVYFSNDSSHAAVFIPVQGGNLCIVDPAGSYLTRSLWQATSKPALQELQSYSNHWSQLGGISKITLYEVSKSGDYVEVVSGTISQVAAALK